MKKTRIRKTPEPTVGTIDHRSQKALELATTEPDLLRNSVREALSHLPEEERRAAHNGLLSSLKGAGVNIGHHLLVLGIPARTAEELTAPEIASLIRYVRINETRAMMALAPVLSELLAAQVEPARKFASRAA
jgi:hypothetical protein